MRAKEIFVIMVALVFAVALTSHSRADALTEGKYELKEFKDETIPAIVDGAKQMPANTKNFLTKEVAKTKEYQKNSWADAKEQNAKTFGGIKKFFTNLTNKGQ
jgi:hypothetical protein